MNEEIRPDMAKHPLAIAAREVNDLAEKKDLAETIEQYDLKLPDLLYMANQRALRGVYAAKGINLNLKEAVEIALSPEEKRLHVTLTSCYMDGLLIGWRAREIRHMSAVTRAIIGKTNE